MKLLALDTSTNVCSICIADEGHIVAEYMTQSEITHSERLMPAVDLLFSHLDWPMEELDGLAVVHGPGSFTGLRIGLSVVKGLAFALNCPVAVASALEVAARQVPFTGLVCPVMDARRGEIFTCLFEKFSDGGLSIQIEPMSVKPELWKEQLPGRPVYFCGPGAHLYWNVIKNHIDSVLLFRNFVLAPTLIRLAVEKFIQGDVLTSAEVKAAYLRPSDAETKGPKPPRKLERISQK